MRLARAIRRLIPVVSQGISRATPQLALSVPAAGARWGGPATFDQASRPTPSNKPAGFTVDWIDTTRVFKGVETHREFSRAPVGDIAEPEGIRSVTFYCGSRKERRDAGGVIYTTLIQDYVKLDFPLFAFQGARGEPHPPASSETDA